MIASIFCATTLSFFIFSFCHCFDIIGFITLNIGCVWFHWFLLNKIVNYCEWFTVCISNFYFFFFICCNISWFSSTRFWLLTRICCFLSSSSRKSFFLTHTRTFWWRNALWSSFTWFITSTGSTCNYIDPSTFSIFRFRSFEPFTKISFTHPATIFTTTFRRFTIFIIVCIIFIILSKYATTTYMPTKRNFFTFLTGIAPVISWFAGLCHDVYDLVKLFSWVSF